jgi:hypothetical protein
MQKVITILCIFSLVLAGVSQAFGESKKDKADRYSNVNMSKVTCSDVLNEQDSQAVAAVLVWIDGYLSCSTGDMIVDINKLKSLADQLGGYCRENPSETILDALKKSKQSKY